MRETTSAEQIQRQAPSNQMPQPRHLEARTKTVSREGEQPAIMTHNVKMSAMRASGVRRRLRAKRRCSAGSGRGARQNAQITPNTEKHRTMLMMVNGERESEIVLCGWRVQPMSLPMSAFVRAEGSSNSPHENATAGEGKYVAPLSRRKRRAAFTTKCLPRARRLSTSAVPRRQFK